MDKNARQDSGGENPRPLVTVAMPLFNAAEFLETALGLIRRQTYDNLEILLLDNASTDATGAICTAAAASDSRIRYVRHSENIGAAANFSEGLRRKSGEFFMWAAHDDEKAPEYVERTLEALRRNPAAALACTWTVLDAPDGESLCKLYSPAAGSPRLDERLAAVVRETQCVAFYGLYRSSALDRIGAPDEWLDSDRRYLFKAAIQGPFEVVPEALFRFRLARGSKDYIAMGIRHRPGAADFDLDLYRHFPRLLREAGVGRSERRKAETAIKSALRPYLDRRALYLLHESLASTSPRLSRVFTMFAWAWQYPPMVSTRMFWGALRRVAAGMPG